MGTALRCPHNLAPESVETNGTALRVVVGVQGAAGLQPPLSVCHYVHVIVVFGTFRTLRKRKQRDRMNQAWGASGRSYLQESAFPKPTLKGQTPSHSPARCDRHWHLTSGYFKPRRHGSR